MANDFTDLEHDVNLLVEETMGEVERAFLNITDVIIVEDGAESYTERRAYGSRAWSARSAGTPPSAEAMKAGKSQTTPANYQKLREFELDDVERHPELVLDSVDDFVNGFIDTIETAWWLAVVEADTFTHPLNSKAELTATGGGTAYFADAFTVVPAAIGGGSSFTQKNLYADNLTAANLASGIEDRGQYRTLGGDRADGVGGTTPWLFAVSTLHPTAKALAARSQEIYDGAGLQLGGFTDLNPVVVPAGVTASTTAWGLIWSRMRRINGELLKTAPIMPVIRNNLYIRIGMPSSDNVVHVTGHGSWALHYMTKEWDLQLHKT